MTKPPHLHSVINQKLIQQRHDFELKGIFTFINPFSYLKIRTQSAELIEFDNLGFDGISMCIVWKILHHIDVKRTSFDFTSFAQIVFDLIERTGKSLYIIGSKHNEIEQFIEKISQQYTRLNISGYRNGYFTGDADRTESVNTIIALNPDIVIVGMGAGIQEKFLIDLKKAGWSGCGFTCGGFIHQTAKAGIQYYPQYINKLHLRWLFRIFDEPKLFKRYVFQYPVGVLFMILDYFSFRILHQK